MADETRLYKLHVKPIYDAIDGRQYKTAIKLCQNKRVAGLDLVQVLKAHCLERTGRQNEALDICRAVQRHKPTDETLLNTMSLVFRLCGHELEMLSSYEHACAQATANEELFQLLFMAYARKGDFLKQQQTALKMFKAFAKIKYICWAALSMLLQVQHSGTPSKMLSLADRMLLKAMRDTKSDDGEALQLVVHILQLQGRHEEALQAFDEFAPLMVNAKTSGSGTAKKKAGRASEGEGTFEEDIELGSMQAIDRLALEATLARQVAKWKRCGDVYKELLEKYNADDWTYLTEFIAARINQNGDSSFAAVEADVLAVLEALAAKPGNERLRGPWLAKVHIQGEKLKRLKAAEASAPAVEESMFVERVFAYIERFYMKTCCFSDLKQFLELYDDDAIISTTTKNELVHKLTEMTTAATADTTLDPSSIHEESTRKEALNRLHRRLFSLKSLRFLGDFDATGAAELEALAKSLVAEYEANAWLNLGAKGGQREVQNTDDLLLLAAHTLIDVYQRESSRRELLVEVAALLEYGLEKSAYNFQMKLLLSRIYGYLGASAAMLKRHKELDVKHVQLDSLSYLVFDKLLQLCDHTEARRVCDLIRRQHKITGNETPEYIARAYKLGVYSKVLDMTSFLREKMQNSYALAIARGESLQFELQDALTTGPADLSELLASPKFDTAVGELEKMIQPEQRTLSQNQDRSVVVQWTKEPLVRSSASFGAEGAPLSECDRSADFASSLEWIKLQLVVPKLLRNIGATKIAADGVNEALASEYEGAVSTLGLLNASETNVKTHVWAWSVDVVKATILVAEALHRAPAAQDLSASVDAVTALQAPLGEIRDGVIASLTSGDSLSAYGLSAAALLVRDAGLWAGALLCATTRLAMKKSKKDDPLVAALRSVLKGIQDTLCAVEAHASALQIGSVTDKPLEIVATPSSLPELAAAHSKALDNVSRAHKDALALLSQILKNAATSMRLFQQK